MIAVAAGGVADGSEMVIFDMMGFVPESAMAKHSKAYASMITEGIKAASGFAADVNSKGYPAGENGWGMDPIEYEKFINELEKSY